MTDFGPIETAEDAARYAAQLQPRYEACRWRWFFFDGSKMHVPSAQEITETLVMLMDHARSDEFCATGGLEVSNTDGALRLRVNDRLVEPQS